MRGRVPVVAVLVLLAGCGSAAGPASPGTGTDTVTPAPVPTAPPTTAPAPTAGPTRTTTAARDPSLPPGVTASGIANASALADAHSAALEGRSYRAVTVVNRSTASGWERTREVLRVDGDRVHLVHRERTSGGNDSSRVEYLDGRARYVRCERANGTAACPTGPPSAIAGDAAGTVLVLLSGSDSRLVGTETRLVGNGRAATLRHRLLVTGNPLGLGSPYGVLEARNYTVTALVTPSGLVTDLRASYDLVGGEARIDVTARLRFSSIGSVRVTPPPWYDPNATDANATVDP
ncbi:MAG: hypothetical protein V5A62_08745 [Haloarculaceae archaeon]